MSIFQLPTAEHVAWYCGCLTAVLLLNLACDAILKRRRSPFTREFWIYATITTVALFVDDRTRALINLAYIFWALWGRKFPWGGWKKKLGSNLSSLTEVAKAALQRQTSEAFS